MNAVTLTAKRNDLLPSEWTYRLSVTTDDGAVISTSWTEHDNTLVRDLGPRLASKVALLLGADAMLQSLATKGGSA